jgi:hypothetical protein
MKKLKKASKKPVHQHKTHELAFVLVLAILVSLLGLYAYVQMSAYPASAGVRW